MKKYLVFVVMAAVLSTLADLAMADSIKGKLGVTGRLGFIVPQDSENTRIREVVIVPPLAIGVIEHGGEGKADVTFAGGGGFIYGVTDNLAVEADVTHIPQIDYEISGEKAFEITTTNVSLGLQWRFFPEYTLVPYLGGGVDILLSDGRYLERDDLDVETVVGGHVNAGVDFFITKKIALNADFRGVLAPRAEIDNRNLSFPGNSPEGKYDPISFVALFGARFFLN